MTDQSADLGQPTPVEEIERGASFVSDHLVWFLGLLPLLFACFRVLVASGGNTETLKALVQNLDVTALVLATFLPFVSTVLLWAIIVSTFSSKRKARDNQERSGNASGALLGLAITLIVIWFTMPLSFVIANVAAILTLLFLAVVTALANRLGRVLVALAAIATLAVLVLAPFVVAGMWLPLEQIRIKAETKDGFVLRPEILDTGFVLSSDDVWTKYMDWNEQVHIVRSDAVLDRQVDDLRSWWHRSLADLTS